VINQGNGVAVCKQVQRHLGYEIRLLHRPRDALPAEVIHAERLGVNRHTLRCDTRSMDSSPKAG